MPLLKLLECLRIKFFDFYACSICCNIGNAILLYTDWTISIRYGCNRSLVGQQPKPLLKSLKYWANFFTAYRFKKDWGSLDNVHWNNGLALKISFIYDPKSTPVIVAALSLHGFGYAFFLLQEISMLINWLTDDVRHSHKQFLRYYFWCNIVGGWLPRHFIYWIYMYTFKTPSGVQSGGNFS